MDERIAPAYVTDNETGTKYELDFNREAIAFAERNEFVLDDIEKYPQTAVANLFYYAFRMHHKNFPREKVDKLREKWGGVPENLLTRLILLYQQARMATTVQTTEESEKNSLVTLEL